MSKQDEISVHDNPFLATKEQLDDIYAMRKRMSYFIRNAKALYIAGMLEEDELKVNVLDNQTISVIGGMMQDPNCSYKKIPDPKEEIITKDEINSCEELKNILDEKYNIKL